MIKDAGRSAVTKRAGDIGKSPYPLCEMSPSPAPICTTAGQHLGRGRRALLHRNEKNIHPRPEPREAPDGGIPLNSADKHALVAFLKTLTDQSFLRLPKKIIQKIYFGFTPLKVASARFAP